MLALIWPSAVAKAEIVPLGSLGCTPLPVEAACAARLGWIESQQVQMQSRRIASTESHATLEATRIGVAIALARAGDWAAADIALDSVPMAPVVRLAGRAELAILAMAARKPGPISAAGNEFDTFVNSPAARGLVGGDAPFAYAVGAQINHARGNTAEARRMLAEAKAAIGNIAFSNLTTLTGRIVVATHDIEGHEAAMTTLRAIRIDDGGVGTAATYAWALLARSRSGEARAAIQSASEAVGGFLRRLPPGPAAADGLSPEVWNLLAVQTCLAALDGDLADARAAFERFPRALARTASIYDARAYNPSNVLVDSLRRIGSACLALAHHRAGEQQAVMRVMGEISIDDQVMLGHEGIHASEGFRALVYGLRGYSWSAIALVWAAAGNR
jgi:hypothetical protein